MQSAKVSKYKVLIPVDFSPASSMGLAFVDHLSTLLDLNVTMAGRKNHKKVNEDQDTSKNKLDNVKKSLQYIKDFAWLGDLRNFADDLVQCIYHNKFDLLVISGNPQTEINHMLTPTTVRKITSKLKCPILFISRRIDFSVFKDITFYLPLIAEEKYRNITFMNDFAGVIKAKLHLLTVVDKETVSNNKIMQQQQKIAEENKLTSHSINTTHHNDISSGIQFFNDRKNPSMTALAHGKNSRYITLDIFPELLKHNQSDIICLL